MKNRTRRRAARYAGGVFRLSRRTWWSKTRLTPYDNGPRVTVGVAVRGAHKAIKLIRGIMAKDVIAKMAFERLNYA